MDRVASCEEIARMIEDVILDNYLKPRSSYIYSLF